MGWLRLVLVVYASCFFSAESFHDPVVAWSFDRYNDTKLIPEFTSDERFFSDITPLEENTTAGLRPGVNGKGIFLSASSFILAESLTLKDCLFDPDACQGLILSFWVNIQQWNGENDQSIIKTVASSRNLPGIYFGRGDGDYLLVYIKGSKGMTYESTFAQSLAWHRWSSLRIKWSKPNGTISIRVNGTLVTDQTIIGEASRPTETDVASASLVLGGASGPTFYIDELNVYYEDNRTDPHHTTRPYDQTTVADTTKQTTSTPNHASTFVLGTSRDPINPSPPTTNFNPLYIAVPIAVVTVVVIVVLSIWCARRRQTPNRLHDEPDAIPLYDISEDRFEPYHDYDTDETDN